MSIPSSILSRFLCSGLAAAVLLAPLSAPARAQGVTSAGWRAVLSEAGCPAPDLGNRSADMPWSPDQILVLALGFEEISVVELDRRSQIGLLPYVETGKRISDLDNAAAVTDRLLSDMPAAEGKLREAAGRFGAEFCALARIIGQESLESRWRGQQGYSRLYGPDKRVAQHFLAANGCKSFDDSGVFSDFDREAWNRAVEGPLPDLVLGEGSAPAPAAILEFAAHGFPGLACGPGAGAPLHAALLLELADDCSYWDRGAVPRGIGAFLVEALAEERDIGAVMRGLNGLCGDHGLHSGLDLASQLALDSGVHMLPTWAGEISELAELTLRMADFLAAALPDQTDPPRLPEADSLFNHAARLIERPGQADPGEAEFAARVILPLVETRLTGDSWFRPQGVLSHLSLHPGLPADLRADLERAALTSGLWLRDPGLVARAVDGAIAGQDDSTDAIFVARRLGEAISQLISAPWRPFDPGAEAEASGGFGLQDSGLIRPDMTVLFEGVPLLANLARLVAVRPEASDAILALGDPGLDLALASALLEGHSGQPRSPGLTGLALRHMRASAEGGNSMAALRLAQMIESGLGTVPDPAAALPWYEAAARGGQPEGEIALARATETGAGRDPNPEAALRHYARAFGITGPHRPDPANAAALRMRLVLGLGVFGQPAGQEMEVALQRRVLALGEEEPWRQIETAYRIALDHLSSASGLAPDPGRAVDWLRIAAAMDLATWQEAAQSEWTDAEAPPRPRHEAAILLAQILAAEPDLAARPMPAGLAPADIGLDEVIRAQPFPPGGSRADPPPWALCADSLHPEIGDCADAAARAATGAHGPDPMRAALDWLRDRAAEEASEQRSSGYLAAHRVEAGYVESGYVSMRREAWASAALAQVLAFWGDWQGAQEAARPFPWLPLHPAFAPREDQFRRLASRAVEGRAPAGWPEILATLEVFAARGDAQSAEILDLAEAMAGDSSGEGVAEAPAADLDAARETFAIAEPLGQGSAGLAWAARRLAPLEAAAGNGARAVELELIALNTDLARAGIDSLLHGPLPGDLTRICGWSRASERLFAIGENALALTLAELAVNRLQALRAGLTGLPESLQLCFRDQVSDHYRWLAGLYIDADRHAEADHVLMLLKDFETYRFVGNDADFGPRAAEILAPHANEAAVTEALSLATPTVTGQSIRRRELLLARRDAPLSAAETTELEALEASLGAAAKAREATITALVEAASAIGRPGRGDDLMTGKTIKRHLRALGEGSRAAAIQYVVLDGRIGIVLTTPVSQQAFVVDRLGDDRLDPGSLARAVEDFRAALTDPRRDPRPPARILHNLLLPPELRAELAAGGIDRLVLSLDGPLRYVPAAALHDGERWLIEDFTLSHVTGAPMAERDADLAEFAGFGVTRALGGLPALPGVAEELARISGPEGPGLEARVWLDEAFTRDSLASALFFGDGFSEDLGILHLASHFKLGRTEAESFLLMGDGSMLSVAELRAGFGSDLDFSELGLLTLSACETGYGLTGPGGNGGEDGAELESFAAVAQGAGARAVVATLWPVNDRSVAEVMAGFYRNAFAAKGATDGGDLARALALTQRDFLSAATVPPPDSSERAAVALDPSEGGEAASGAPSMPGYSHPYHWAAIVLMEGAG
ncbi:CHAT domain-containing protein [Pseudogemmobacter sonorensis]|uniref:CHAT domain-containing protein n=1 Tax=Pseudogemmobacter sonorensis TaxID=2989681 RepID=UPI003696206C